MKTIPRITALLAVLLGCGLAARPDDLVISLPGTVSQKAVVLQCDSYAKTLGLPLGPFTVTYLNAENNSLAVLPINGHPLIFAQVMSADGSRYAASRFIWWDAGFRGIHLYADGSSKEQTACRAAR